MNSRRFALAVTLILASLLPLSRSDAITLSSETAAGAATFSQSLAADGDLPWYVPGSLEDERDTRWGWNVSALLARTSHSFGATSGAVATTVIDNTTEVGGGVSWTGAGALGASGDLVFSSTPEEQLKSLGATLGMTYEVPVGAVLQAIKKPVTQPQTIEIDESEPNEDESEPFQPTLRLKASLGTRGYEQSLSSGSLLRRPGRAPISTPLKNEVRQTSVGLSARWSPLEDWSFELAGTHYSYSKDTTTFTTLLDSPRALRAGPSALSNMDGGFPDWSVSVSMAYYANERLRLSVSTTQFAISTNKTMASETRATADLSLTRVLRGMIGAEYMSSYFSYDTLGLIGLELSL